MKNIIKTNLLIETIYFSYITSNCLHFFTTNCIGYAPLWLEYFSGYSNELNQTFELAFYSAMLTILLLGNLFAIASVRYYKRLYNIGGNQDTYLCTACPKYYTICLLLTVSLFVSLITHYLFYIMSTGTDKNSKIPILFLIDDLIALPVMLFYILKEQDLTLSIIKRHLSKILCLDNRVDQMELDDPGIYIGPPGGSTKLNNPGIYIGPSSSHSGEPMDLDDPGVYMGPSGSLPG